MSQRLKGESESKDKKTLKLGTKKRELKLTVSRALNVEEIEVIDNVKSFSYRMKNPVGSGSKRFFRVLVDYK